MTYKGCQRKIIMLNNPGGDMFEQAYFILKDEKENVSESDMIKEANRIVSEALSKSSLSPQMYSKNYVSVTKRNKINSIMWFGLGTSFGACLTYLFFQILR